MPNQQRMDAFKRLEPVAAIQAWLDGDFGIDEEPALCAAIRKDSRITLSDDDIADTISEALDDERDAEACLERLAAAH
jgi:hypothetical protein